jgi:hypothetical protein
MTILSFSHQNPKFKLPDATGLAMIFPFGGNSLLPMNRGILSYVSAAQGLMV